MEGASLEQLAEAVRRRVPRTLFAGLAGEHLTGVGGQGTAYRVEGVMLLPARQVLGLRPVSETRLRRVMVGGWSAELRFADLKPVLDRLAGTRNTELLEVLFAPQVVIGGEEHARLLALARQFLTRAGVHDLLRRSEEPRARLRGTEAVELSSLLEGARLVLAAVHLAQTGQLCSRAGDLAERTGELWLKAFLRRQSEEGAEAAVVPEEASLVGQDLERLSAVARAQLDRGCPLPDEGGSVTALDELLVELRLRELQGG